MLRVPASLGLALAWATLLALAAPSARSSDEGADGRFSLRRSSGFVVLQDVKVDRRFGVDGSRRFERDVLEVLEQARRRVSDVLGVRPRRPIQVVIYDPAVYDAQLAGRFQFASAGFYDGAIHVRGSGRLEARLVRTLHHEYVHAALDEEAGSFALPGLVNEGLAEWLESLAVGKRHLTPGEHAALSDAARRGELIPLQQLLVPAFSTLGPERVGLAYLESYATIEHLVRRHGQNALRRFCAELLRTRNLERALGRAFGTDLGELESAQRSELA
jgi:hypothetical protein